MILKRALAGIGLSLFALTSLSACGESRPSADDVSEAIMKEGDVTQEQADCAGKVFYESDLSDETLDKAVNSDTDVFENEDDLPAEDKKAMQSEEFVGKLLECLGGEMPEVEVPTDEEMTPDPSLEDPAMPEDGAGTFEEGTDPSGSDTE